MLSSILETAPTEVVLRILDYVTAADEDRLLQTCRHLKILILVCKYGETVFTFVPSMNSRLFNIVLHQFPFLLNASQVSYRLSLLLGEFTNLVNVPYVILAGGSVSMAVDPSVSDDYLMDSSTDLDIFLYGDPQQKSSALQYIKDILEPYGPIFNLRSNVIDVLIKGKRVIQLVLADNRTRHPYDVISQFDLGFVQFFYDGKGVYGTNVALSALMTRITIMTPSAKHIQRERWDKTIKKGFTIKGDVKIEDTNDFVVKNRYFVQCVKRDFDNGTLDNYMLNAFPKRLDIEHIMSRMKAWKGLENIYGMITHNRYSHYTDFVDEKTFDFELERIGNHVGRLRGYDFKQSKSNIRIRSCILTVVGCSEEPYDTNRIYVLESPFSQCRKAFIAALESKGFPLSTRERLYENEWMTLVLRTKVIQNMFENVVHRKLQIGDQIVVEAIPKYWREEPRRRLPGRQYPSYLSFHVTKVVLLS